MALVREISSFTWKRYLMTVLVLTMTFSMGMIIGSLLLLAFFYPAMVFGSLEFVKAFLKQAPLLAGLFAIPAFIYSLFAAAFLLPTGPPYRFGCVCGISILFAAPLALLTAGTVSTIFDFISLPQIIAAWALVPAIVSAGVVVPFLRAITRLDSRVTVPPPNPRK